MKYDSLRKTKRNNKIIAYFNKHPELSLKEIGEKYGISPSRVHRIVHKDDKIIFDAANLNETRELVQQYRNREITK